MVSDKQTGTLLVTVGTRGVGVFAWEGITKSEIKETLKAIQQFAASKRTNRFQVKCGGTGKEIIVRAIPATPAMNDPPASFGELSPKGIKLSA
jgi:hypothetical protein